MYRAVKPLPATPRFVMEVTVAERPAYLHIADDLREAIRNGSYPPGSRLPTHAELAQHYNVSEIVIRSAIGVLKAEGLVDTATRAGTVVRPRPPVRRIGMDRYRIDARPQVEPATSFTRDQGIAWAEYRLDKHFTWTDANPELAALFEVEPGMRVLERRFVFWARGEPAQMSRSCLLATDVENTPVADPHNEPWPGGNIAQLRTLGIEVTSVLEAVASRMPSPEETATLRIATGVPVFAITRRMLAGERVVEVADPIVIPADRAVLDYRVDL